MEHIGIVDFCRSPISKAKDGGLNQLSILEIATRVVRALLDRNPAVPRDLIEVVAAGCAFPEAEAGFNIGRCISVKAGLPAEVAGLTLNQFCGSSQTTVALIADMLAVGKGKIGIAVGLEHMKHIPMGGFNPLFDKELSEMNFYIGMGDTAENLAKELQISREDQEAYSMYSHEKALAAWASGAFDREVIPMSLPDGSTLIKDECPMPPNPEKMRSLSPAFDIKGSVTAATSSPVTSGAGAALIMTEGMAKELGLSLRATIVTTAMAGCDWTRMGMGPLPATEKALTRAKMKMDDFDVIELNEAFAAQSLYVIRKGGWDERKINLLGGAIALGHPLGMSGVRIVGTAITALEQTGGTFALATMCVGGGQGVSTILKRG
ncbi:MAG: hypothetical protein A2284_05005 [Deltaproteobacteria bacterium RIFOXYA12_FULL_61_11]|nr:MAG: hypothetical protein A2284_05005 [Deltaproteobacteria bacterium RIFOXYA12_FULL_61_11]